MTLRVHHTALDAVKALAPIVRTVARHDKSLADQMRRASSSIVLNVAEAEGNDGGTARARFHTAAGSTKETRAALELAIAWGYVTAARPEEADTLLDKTAAQLWRLLHPRP